MYSFEGVGMRGWWGGGGGGVGGEYSLKNWVAMCGPLPGPLPYLKRFKTKICDFPHSIYDLTKHSILSKT